MGIIELLGLAGSVSLLSGWRLYATVLITGLAMRSGWVPLPEQLQMLDVLANPWVLGIAGVGAVMEFFADKVMWLDSIWDAVHSLIRPVGGAERPPWAFIFQDFTNELSAAELRSVFQGPPAAPAAMPPPAPPICWCICLWSCCICSAIFNVSLPRGRLRRSHY